MFYTQPIIVWLLLSNMCFVVSIQTFRDVISDQIKLFESCHNYIIMYVTAPLDFQTLVLSELLNLHMTSTQMISYTEFVSRPV